MCAIIQKEEVEWGYIFTLTKRGFTLHSRDTKDKLFEVQHILDKYPHIFREMHKIFPLSQVLEHTVELESGAKPIMITSYRNIKIYKDEIEKIIKELLYMGFIQPSSSPFSSSIVLVKKKDRTMRMCINYKLLNKKITKNRYPIPRLDDLIDELHGDKYVLK